MTVARNVQEAAGDRRPVVADRLPVGWWLAVALALLAGVAIGWYLQQPRVWEGWMVQDGDPDTTSLGSLAALDDLPEDLAGGRSTTVELAGVRWIDTTAAQPRAWTSWDGSATADQPTCLDWRQPARVRLHYRPQTFWSGVSGSDIVLLECVGDTG